MIDYTDYFVICTGRTDRQAKGIHDGIHLGMKSEHGMLPRRVEGFPEARWILMDYLDVIVHVFTPEVRDYYPARAALGRGTRVADRGRGRVGLRVAAGRSARARGALERSRDSRYGLSDFWAEEARTQLLPVQTRRDQCRQHRRFFRLRSRRGRPPA